MRVYAAAIAALLPLFAAACKKDESGGSSPSQVKPAPESPAAGPSPSGVGPSAEPGASPAPAPAPAPEDASPVSPGADPTTPTPAAAVGTLGVDNVGDVTAADLDLNVAGAVALVVPASETGLPASSVGTLVATNGASLAELSDFDARQAAVTVRDPSMQALDQVNTVLCLAAQTGYPAMVGQGAYVAMVDGDRCYESDVPSSESAKLLPMTVKAEREPNRPVAVSFWFKNDSGVDLAAKLLVAKGPTSANPFGIFRLRYRDGDVKGAVEAYETVEGKVFLNIHSGAAGSVNRAAAVMVYDDASKKITSGIAHASSSGGSLPPGAPGGGDTVYKVAFDAEHYHTKKSGSDDLEQCRDRVDYRLDASEYATFAATDGSAYRPQGVYLTLSRSVGGRTYEGEMEAGYLRFFDPEAPAISDGDTINAKDPAKPQEASQAYTALLTAGVLTETRREQLPDDFVKTSRFLVDNDVIRYNATESRFDVVARKNFDLPGTTRFVDIVPEAYTPAGSSLAASTEARPDLAVTVYVDGADVSADRTVQKPVLPATDLVLWCFNECPRGGLSKSVLDQYQTDPGNQHALLYHPAANDVSTMVRYVYDAETGNLLDADHGNDVVSTAIDLTGDDVNISSGRLVPDSRHQVLKSDPEYFQTLASSETTFSWSSGFGDSARRILLLDPEANPVRLAALPRYVYKHTQEKDRRGNAGNPRYGESFDVSLDIRGLLQGIPSLVGEDGDQPPVVSLKDGVALDENLKLKAGRVIERMPIVAASECAAVALDAVPELPKQEFAADSGVGAAPTVSGAAKVIGGLVVAD